MQIFRGQQSKNRSKPRLSWSNSNKIQKRRFVIFAVIFGLLGGYIVFRSFAATTLTGADGEFTPMTQVRILNTTNGIGGRSTPLLPGETYKLKVAGVGGVPSANLRAISLNVVAAAPTATGYLTVWQSGISQPATSTLNFAAGKYISNHVIAQVGSDGYIQINNSAGAGNTHVVVDVNGYYTTSGSAARGARYTPVAPSRILNTTTGVGIASGQVQSGQTITTQITGKGGVPSTGVTAVVMNVVAISRAYNGWMTLWPAGTTRPTTSSVNYTTNQMNTNLVTVKLNSSGQVSLYNSGSNVDILFEVQGYYGSTSSSSNQVGRFVPVTPTRIIDTSSSNGGYSRLINSGETVALPIAGRGGLPFNDMQSAVLNITAVPASSTAGYLTVWSAGDANPFVYNLNYNSGEPTATQAVIKKL